MIRRRPSTPGPPGALWSRALPGLLVLCVLGCGGDGASDSPPACGLDAAAGDASTADASSADASPGEVSKKKKRGSATSVLFDDMAPVRRFHIEVKEQDWAWLQANAIKEQYVPASVSYEGEVYPQAHVRFKGGFGSLMSCFDKQGKRLCKKLSLKVSFNKIHKKGRFHGVRKLVFNACNRDKTCLRERLSYALFRRAGVVAPRAVHAMVQVNDEPPGLYLLVEYVDKEFVEDHFEYEEGNLYKEAWPDKLSPLPYVKALRTNEEVADVSRMVSFAKALKQTPDSGFVALAETWIDRKVMSRYLVVDQLVHNWDGIWKFYCIGAGHCGNHNFYIYDDAQGSGRLVVIPWDLDHTFNSPNADMGRSWWEDGPGVCDVKYGNPIAGTRAPQCDPLLRGLMRQGWKMYLGDLDALTAQGGALSLEAQRTLLDRYRAMVTQAVAEDPTGPGVAAWGKATAVLREVIAAQHAHARALLTWEGP